MNDREPDRRLRARSPRQLAAQFAVGTLGQILPRPASFRALGARGGPAIIAWQHRLLNGSIEHRRSLLRSKPTQQRRGIKRTRLRSGPSHLTSHTRAYAYFSNILFNLYDFRL